VAGGFPRELCEHGLADVDVHPPAVRRVEAGLRLVGVVLGDDRRVGLNALRYFSVGGEVEEVVAPRDLWELAAFDRSKFQDTVEGADCCKKLLYVRN
jgi:hypothetical protein